LYLSNSDVEILCSPDDVAPFVGRVCEASDKAKNALGFLPKQVYEDSADQGKLLVAVLSEGTRQTYAGHLLFGGAFPHARIFQVFTLPECRGHGIGRRLVEAAVRRAEGFGFMSLVARVADDLDANMFWQHMGFEVVRTKQGGRSSGREINVRVRELDTPRLFPVREAGAEPGAQDLKLASRLRNVSPVYVLDVNVLFDLVKRRQHANEVERIVRASFNNLIRLAVTEEFVRELERTSRPSPTDPILEFAAGLPCLAAPPGQELNEIQAVLGAMIFPAALPGGRLREQDQSDLVHLATAVHCGASGFVTSEKAILRARPALLSKYSLDVIGVGELADAVDFMDSGEPHEVRAISSGRALEGRPMRDDEAPQVRTFLGRMRCPVPLIEDAISVDLARSRRRMVVACEGSLVGFGSWDLPSSVRPQIQAFLCVDEDHGALALAGDFLLESMSRESVPDCPLLLSLRLLPGHVTTRRIATSHGFRPSANEPSNTTNLQKIAIGKAVTAESWSAVREELRRRTGLGLPSTVPRFESNDQLIRIVSPGGQSIAVTVEELETLLSPAIFFLPGRDGAIVPIRRVYAADLLGGAKQLSLLMAPEAVLLRERIYFSNPRTAGVLKNGTPILFYESAHKGGSGSVIAAARVIRAEHVSKEGANRELLRRGVLDRKMLGDICLAKKVVAATIDNIMLLKNQVKFGRLRQLGAIDGANLITSRTLSANLLIQIVEEGML